ncbi:hypothetical protein HPHPH11_1001 [Helicobacter pylori Hp H-11]|nr:hypothetical protein HPHPH11_1001 [Helicobacter pylori Hp H-11]
MGILQSLSVQIAFPTRLKKILLLGCRGKISLLLGLNIL